MTRITCRLCMSYMTEQDIEDCAWSAKIHGGATYYVCSNCENRKTPLKDILPVIDEEVL